MAREPLANFMQTQSGVGFRWDETASLGAPGSPALLRPKTQVLTSLWPSQPRRTVPEGRRVRKAAEGWAVGHAPPS